MATYIVTDANATGSGVAAASAAATGSGYAVVATVIPNMDQTASAQYTVMDNNNGAGTTTVSNIDYEFAYALDASETLLFLNSFNLSGPFQSDPDAPGAPYARIALDTIEIATPADFETVVSAALKTKAVDAATNTVEEQLTSDFQYQLNSLKDTAFEHDPQIAGHGDNASAGGVNVQLDADTGAVVIDASGAASSMVALLDQTALQGIFDQLSTNHLNAYTSTASHNLNVNALPLQGGDSITLVWDCPSPASTSFSTRGDSDHAHGPNGYSVSQVDGSEGASGISYVPVARRIALTLKMAGSGVLALTPA